MEEEKGYISPAELMARSLSGEAIETEDEGEQGEEIREEHQADDMGDGEPEGHSRRTDTGETIQYRRSGRVR